MLDDDPEGLHQMRVALRRLRAAISLFSDMLPDPQTSALKTERSYSIWASECVRTFLA
jgi:CHAD domain-containing protein